MSQRRAYQLSTPHSGQSAALTDGRSGIVIPASAHRKHVSSVHQPPASTHTSLGETYATIPVPLAMISLPSQNRGSSFPGTKCRSTLSFVMTHIRIQPPDEPSRAIARASADVSGWRRLTLTIPDKFDSLSLSPALSIRRVAVSVDICRSRT